MSDDLLPYYRNELSFIRRLASEFAEDHPRMAERLKLGPDGSADPHVERLIEAFAFLTARIRRKLDDDFPEITQSLLGVLYPHYLAPIPSMAIVQFKLDKAQADLVGGYSVARHALLDSEPTSEGPCRFRTCYDVKVFPFEVAEAQLKPLPMQAPGVPKGSAGVLRIALRCFGKETTFSQMALSSLRFYLRGQEQHVLMLYELLMNSAVEVALAASPTDPNPVLLGKESIRAVGFDENHNVLPSPPRSFPGYRLLTEYFTFNRKFLFFDITGLDAAKRAKAGREPELRIYLDRSLPELEHNVAADMFRLGCTPIVNLFPKKAEPIQMTQSDFEYRVVADSRRPTSFEVYSVDSVTLTSKDGEEAVYHPFYSLKHGGTDARDAAFWHASRRPATRVDEQVDHGSEVYLSFLDAESSGFTAADATVDVMTTCSNRDLPAKLPSGGGRPGLRLVDGGPVSAECLSHPTMTLRPVLGQGTLWRLVSHLSLNHLSLGDAEGSPDALREVLRLYDFVNQPETQARISSILNVNHRRVVGRAGGVAAGGFCRGTEVTVQFDEELFPDNGLYLFASVLEQFMGLYCSINSFTQFVAMGSRRKGELRRWSPRVGEKALL